MSETDLTIIYEPYTAAAVIWLFLWGSGANGLNRLYAAAGHAPVADNKIGQENSPALDILKDKIAFFNLAKVKV